MHCLSQQNSAFWARFQGYSKLCFADLDATQFLPFPRLHIHLGVGSHGPQLILLTPYEGSHGMQQ